MWKLTGLNLPLLESHAETDLHIFHEWALDSTLPGVAPLTSMESLLFHTSANPGSSGVVRGAWRMCECLAMLLSRENKGQTQIISTPSRERMREGQGRADLKSIFFCRTQLVVLSIPPVPDFPLPGLNQSPLQYCPYLSAGPRGKASTETLGRQSPISCSPGFGKVGFEVTGAVLPRLS